MLELFGASKVHIALGSWYDHSQPASQGEREKMMNLIENFPFSGGLIGLRRFETFTTAVTLLLLLATRDVE